MRRRLRLEQLDTHRIIRASVVLIILGLLLVAGVLLKISALTVGLYMLGSALITLGIIAYLVAVISELRRQRAI
jgi:hypothetical protein